VRAGVPSQPTLFDRGAPTVDAGALAALGRVYLDAGAWLEYLPAWVSGEDALMDALVRGTSWHSERRQMYDRVVDVPRLVASLPEDGPGHPLIERMRDVLSAHYETAFARVSMGYYRNGADSVAWHGDYVAREMEEPTVVATVSLGAPRRFLLRPRGGGPSAAFSLGRGDLFVMGGACQRTWQHAIPKVARALPRLAVMFRPIWDPIELHSP
jgi:alkylated DNA repair dioxygenase AlkB